MYFYLLHEKSKVSKVFKDFKLEVEKQLGKPIKSIRSDRGGEYYGRHIEMGYMLGLFTRFLKENDIVP